MMKYKAVAVAVSAFLAVFSILYIYLTVVDVLGGYAHEKVSVSYIKQEFFRIKDKSESVVPFKEQYIALKGLYDKITFKRYFEYENQSVALLDNGYLVYGTKEKNETDVIPLAESVVEFNDLLSKDGIDMIYVQAPEKLCQHDKGARLPSGIYGESPDMSEFLEYMRENGVDVMDIEEEIHSEGLDHYTLFFRSDHHWRPETGFWVNGLLCERLKTDYGYEIDSRTTDIDNYTCDVYENCFIGPQGRRAGYLSAPRDDFSLIYPGFDTDLTVTINGVSESGAFDEAVFRKEHIATGMFTSDTLYYVYTDRLCDYKVIKNNGVSNGKKVVFLCDSFGWTVAPYLALTCGEVHMLDLREVKDTSAYDYVKSVGADSVIILYNAGFVGADERFFDFSSVKE